jgi:peptide/nickel transport system substrate-binding protein
MDKLLAQASSATDNTQRGDLYKQVGQLYAEDVPTIPLFWDPEFITNRAGVEGIKIGPPFEFNYSPLSFSADAKPASGANDTLIIGTTDQLNSLDPQDAYATHDWEILKNTGVSLMKYTPGTADLVPGAAADAPVASDDAKTWTFKLRDNLVFADGTKITSQNYVDSWTRLNKIQGQVAGLVKTYVDSVEAPDPLTVVYHLKNPTSFFPAVAATPPFIPVNPADGFTADAILAYPKTLNGMGPYKMTSYTSGQQLVLEANENYWGDDKPTIKKIIVQYFADPTTLANAVSNGSIDIAWRKLGPQEAQQLQTVQGLTVTKINAPALRYLVMNETWKP